MEGWSTKNQDTASTNFYPSNSSKAATPSLTNIFSKLNQSNDRTLLITLQNDVNKIKQLLQSNREDLMTLFEAKDLQSCIEEIEANMRQLKNIKLHQIGQIKQKIDCQIGQLQKEILYIRKEWNLLKKQFQSQMAEEMQELKVFQKKQQAKMNNLTKQVHLDVKTKLSNLR